MHTFKVKMKLFLVDKKKKKKKNEIIFVKRELNELLLVLGTEKPNQEVNAADIFDDESLIM